MERWNGKVAVVTGASAGIGAAISVTLAEKGLIVVGLARRDEKIKELARTSKGIIKAVKCDLNVESDIIAAFKWIEDNLGGVDILINNAGLGFSTTLTSGEVKDWKSLFDVNVIALSICTREALKTMRTRGDNGHIIHVNSLLGVQLIQTKSMNMYAASKFAVTTLAHTLRYELRDLKSRIKVTNLCPGAVITDMLISCGTTEGFVVPEKGSPEADNFLGPQDLADSVVAILSMKSTVEVQEFILNGIIV